MIPDDISRKIRYIQIYTSKAVNDTLAGEYHSVFKGRGMEFDEVREYSSGDEIRSIDWNVTARMGAPYVKRFVEERELTVIFMVDLSASGAFGSVYKLKNEILAELCALLAFSAIKNNDKVGLIIFTDQVEMFIPPAKGTTHVLRLIRELLEFSPGRSQTDIAAGIEYLARVTNRKSVVFLVSDFIGQGYEQRLRVMGKRHDLIAVSVTDPREVKMPDVGMLELEDSETGQFVLIDTGSKAVRTKYEKLCSKRQRHLKEMFRSMDIDQIEIFSDQDYLRELVKFFRTRERRLRK
ncbi:MAG: DUF58 domain-containing protein [Deltaproteobacteria bacterium]|nr:DUF58 domain-containing protein [Deltaproteobacteria bacterium]MBW2219027.1 DUF58 domain-containing protein [Deltaproteobacteria bacterium]